MRSVLLIVKPASFSSLYLFQVICLPDAVSSKSREPKNQITKVTFVRISQFSGLKVSGGVAKT